MTWSREMRSSCRFPTSGIASSATSRSRSRRRSCDACSTSPARPASPPTSSCRTGWPASGAPCARARCSRCRGSRGGGSRSSASCPPDRSSRALLWMPRFSPPAAAAPAPPVHPRRRLPGAPAAGVRPRRPARPPDRRPRGRGLEAARPRPRPRPRRSSPTARRLGLGGALRGALLLAVVVADARRPRHEDPNRVAAADARAITPILSLSG